MVAFLKEMSLAEQLTECRITVQGVYIPITLLLSPAKLRFSMRRLLLLIRMLHGSISLLVGLLGTLGKFR